MFVNRVKINLSTIPSGSTATTINIPLNLEYQLVDQFELIEKVFVDVETEKAINPISDYEKVRFVPSGNTNQLTARITYRLDLAGAATYDSIGFVYSDVNLEKESFKQTFVNLQFYDTPNRLTQKLITQTTIFSTKKPENLDLSGTLKPLNSMLLEYRVESPIYYPLSESEGFHIYDYKDGLQIGESKYLYMRASFKNAKTGEITNLMVKNTALPIDTLINNLYTRYELFRTNTGFYYKIDGFWDGNSNLPVASNNVVTTGNDIVVNLYKILAT